MTACSRSLTPGLRGGSTAVLLAAALAVSGCNRTDRQEPAGRPFEGETVGVAAPAGLDLPTKWQIILDEWGEQTGAHPRVAEYHAGGDEAARVERLADRISENATGGVIVLPLTDLAEAADRGLLAPVPGELASGRFDWLDLFQGLRENVVSMERRPVAVPISSPVLVCYFRSDLLRRAGLSPPQTWADYQKLLASLDRWAPGLTAAEPWGEEFRATMFLARAVSYARHPGNFSLFFDIDSGEPLIHEAGFVRALEASQAALRRMPDAVTAYTPADCRREFLAGRAALAIAFETGPESPPFAFGPAGLRRGAVSSAVAESSAGKRAEDLTAGFVRLPGSREVYNHSLGAWQTAPGGRPNQMTLTGFAGLCAAVAAGGGAPAWNLLERLAIEEQAAAFPEGTRTPVRNSQLAEPYTWVGRDLTAAEAGEYLHVVAESLRDTRLVTELPVVGRSEFRAALTAGLDAVLAGDASADDALQRVSIQWREIAERIGTERLTDSYRRSLGLHPRPRP